MQNASRYDAGAPLTLFRIYQRPLSETLVKASISLPGSRILTIVQSMESGILLSATEITPVFSQHTQIVIWSPSSSLGGCGDKH